MGGQRGGAGCVCAPRGVAFAEAEGEAVLAQLRRPLAPASLADAAMGSGELLWGVKTHLWFPLCLLWPLFGRVLRLA